MHAYIQLEDVKRQLIAAEDEILLLRDDRDEQEHLVNRIRALEAEKQKQKYVIFFLCVCIYIYIHIYI
jgi:hypothetical protein